MIFPKKILSPFVSLNLTQFFSAINDNLYKLLLVFLLIHIKGAQASNSILALAGAIFVIPFILFASLAGTLADRYSKRTLIYITRILEIIIMILGLLSFAYKSAWGGYSVLFLLATHSALFSPCKYGILPELVKKEQLSHYNGLLTATTYLAIIFGTFLASLLTDITHKNFVLSSLFCIAIAFLSALSSLGIKKTFPQAAEKKISFFFVSEVIRTLKKAKQIRYLLGVLLFGAYFLFMGSYTQLNIIPYTIQSLGLSEVYGGYLFLMTAIGIGLGSFSAGHFSGKHVELGFVPMATLGVALCYFSLYFFVGHMVLVVLTLFLMGFFGGFFIVPIDAFIQEASPRGDRGQNVATANLMSFIGVVIAAGLLAFLGSVLQLEARFGFLVVGCFTLLLGISLIFFFLDQILRLIVSKVAKHFWNLRVEGLPSALTQAPVLLIGKRRSWLDTLIVMATLPRLIRYIVPIRRHIRGRRLLYKLLQLIPLDISYFSPLKTLTMEKINKEIAQGHSVCLMQPMDHNSLKAWEELPQLPIVVIEIFRESTPSSENSLKAVKKLFSTPITIRYRKVDE
jgi:acyl-[acyl-carrier-protein]-phospholipid O-acyltransferase/long-chain-fatty-acid--[acyl-carrier-protein] ligase